MNKNDGGPAFGGFEKVGDIAVREGGISMRDYFAAKALNGYLASMSEDSEPSEVASTIAEHCYKLADAMLKARMR